MMITSKLIRERLREKMIDPELNINVVDLGLVYKVEVSRVPQVARVSRGTQYGDFKQFPTRHQPSAVSAPKVHILMSLTTPGCPLAAVFHPMVRQALSGIPGLDPYKDVEIELTFDPPWHQGMMSERAKAEMGMG